MRRNLLAFLVLVALLLACIAGVIWWAGYDTEPHPAPTIIFPTPVSPVPVTVSPGEPYPPPSVNDQFDQFEEVPQ